MALSKRTLGRRLKGLAIAVAGGAWTFGILGSCDDKLVEATRYFDPCGTILNCTPGFFETRNADVADWTIDPTCPIAGTCQDDPYRPLGTVWDLDP